MASAAFSPLSSIFSSSKPASFNKPTFPDSPSLQQSPARRQFIKGLTLLVPFTTIIPLHLPSPSEAKEVEVGSYLPQSTSDPNFVLFQASSKDTPALRADSKKKRRHLPGISSSLHETATIAVQNPLFVLADAAVGYSSASYYTSLGLFVISVPGLWSLIKRSVKSKVVQKTLVEEEREGKKKAPNQVAGQILSFFTRNNFLVLDKGETITFEGMMVPSRGQAALLTFCTCISLASVALVLTITVPDVGNNWFGLTLLSPLAGVYYWNRASRKEQIKVKMMVAEDGTLSEIIVQGDDQQVEQMRKELQLSEKGMVYVKGIFER